MAKEIENNITQEVNNSMLETISATIKKYGMIVGFCYLCYLGYKYFFKKFISILLVSLCLYTISHFCFTNEVKGLTIDIPYAVWFAVMWLLNKLWGAAYCESNKENK